jgi:hypothetical protein
VTTLHSPVEGWIGSHRNILFLLTAFIIPLIVRVIPEILMGQFLAGFDTMAYYVPYTIVWIKNGVGFWTLLGTAPLFYLILMGVTSGGLPVIISLKIISPLLLGFLGLAVYSYANRTLLWSFKKSLFVALLATLYFVSLRISWDLLRTELALVFVFVLLILFTKDRRSFRTCALLSLFMLLVVFSDQLVALVMFSIVLTAILASHFSKQLVQARRLIFCSIPAVVMFFTIFYAALVSSQISFSNGLLSQGTQGLLTLFGFSSLASSVFNTLGFLVFCYLPFLPLLVLNFRRSGANVQLKAWIVLIFLAIILSAIIPNALVGASPYRWVLLLTYPLAFIVVEVLSTLESKSLKILLSILLISIVILSSTGFVIKPSQEPFQYFSSYPLYFPTTMLENTVPLNNCQDTVNSLQWAKSNMENNSLLLVHEAFYGWATLTFNRSQLAFYGFDNPSLHAEKLSESNSSYHLYLIWWTNGTGWYGQYTVSSSFRQIHQSGNIAIYLYNPVQS